MSEQQIQRRSRRRFLADLLFLGGAVGAGAFLTRATSGGDEPKPHPGSICNEPEPFASASPSQSQPAPQESPSPASTPQPACDDAPQPTDESTPQPAIEGEDVPPQPPQPAMPGRVAMPQPSAPIIERKDMNIQGGFTPPSHRPDPQRQAPTP